MRRWLKVTLALSISFIIVFIIGGFIFYKMLISSLPEYKGEMSAPGISGEIEIYRDSMAIPYIFAKSEEDAAFALGFLHAQERLFQMDIIRRAGEGRLSEIFGKKTLPYDKMFLTIGIKRTVQKNLKRIDPYVLKLLNAYSKGVNLYIKEAKGKYPIEFDALGYDPYEWKPEHSLIVARMMSWELNISWWTDISFTHLIQKLGEEKVKEILPDYPENAPYIIPPELKNYPKITTSFIETDKAFRKFIGNTGTHLGSNNWVVNGNMSSSGKPIIANDPHLSYSAPGRWYAAVIRAGDWDAEGFTLPGIPLFVIGKNKNIAWTVTHIMMDDADFYLEKLDAPVKASKYLLDNEWKSISSYTEKIKVKDTLDVTMEIKQTHRGPIISDIHPYSFLYKEKKNGPAISMRWVGNDFSDEPYAFYLINKAKNWNDFRSAVKLFGTPGLNFVYSDNAGNIGYLFGGKLPLRENNNPTFIYDGTTSKYDWKGYVPSDELPELFNPPANYIATANNKVVKEFKYHISNLWEPSSRIERITQLLTSKKKNSVEDYKKYQNDFVSPYAKEITKYILSSFEGKKITDKNLKLSLELFEKWDYEMNEFSQVPTIYAVFFKHLLENIYLDELGDDLFNEFVFVANVPYRSVLKILEQGSSWFDDVNTPEIETKDQIIRKSLVDALSELEELFGKDIKVWQWGRLHQVIFKHPFSGLSKWIDEYINIGPYPIGGDGTTLFNTEYPFNKGVSKYPQFDHETFQNTLGPSMRFIFDFSKPDEFYLVLTTGQSGNVMSNHYKDMTNMWRNGKYLKIKTDEKSIRKNQNKFILMPQ
ncbi:MAG TPA: penicillin acylase family protein [Ignavibacteriaceae bacterium]|nr:penicillin acylase family protein [Ignavibacteriaceae bacterium]